MAPLLQSGDARTYHRVLAQLDNARYYFWPAAHLARFASNWPRGAYAMIYSPMLLGAGACGPSDKSGKRNSNGGPGQCRLASDFFLRRRDNPPRPCLLLPTPNREKRPTAPVVKFL